MSGSVEELLNRISGINDKSYLLVEEIRNCMNNKLYHELTLALIELYGINEITCNDRLLLFEIIVHPIKSELNILKFSHILRLSSEQLEPLASLDQLSKYDEFLSSDIQANYMLKIAKSHHHTRNQSYDKSLELLESVKSEIESGFGLDLSVISAYYKVSAKLNKAMHNYNSWYQDSLMYLNYTHLDSINPNERDDLALDIAIASIAAPDNYNFGAVLIQPLINTCLKQHSTYGWAYTILTVLNEGDFTQYDEVISKYKVQISHSELDKHKDQLQRKITLMSFLKLVFRKAKKQRVFTFAEISQHCRIPLNEVEYLLLKAMSNNVVKGKINQVEQVVNFTWVQPRIVDSTKLAVLLEGVNDWNNKVKALIHKLKEITPELLVS